MNILVYSTRPYDREFLEAAAKAKQAPAVDWQFCEAPLNPATAVLAKGHEAVCAFVNDDLARPTLEALAGAGVKLVLLRCTGYNNVDLATATRLGLTVMRVTRYSPHSVAEFAVGLMLSLNRKIHRAWHRVREGNFLLDGLLGFDMHGKTVGIVGTGKIGSVLAKILHGFGCRLLAFDPVRNPELETLGVEYVALPNLLVETDILSLHAPLTPDTRHLIDAAALSQMKDGAMLINTSRGALVDARALIDALKARHLGGVALDVYEEEGDLYFRNLSDEVIPDDVFERLLTFPNVLVTAHQAYFTREALQTIAETTVHNAAAFLAGRESENRLSPP